MGGLLRVDSKGSRCSFGPVKKLQMIPNLVTTANIFCGFLSLLLTMQGHFSAAGWMIILAGVFDLFDGRLARLLGATSSFGENYDTLSDLSSFGIAPAFLLQRLLLPLGDNWALAVSFAYLIAVAYRLARFNVLISESSAAKKSHFSGLSSPPAAATLAAFVILVQSGGVLPQNFPLVGTFVALGLFLAVLMASRIPFPSFKAINWRSAQGITILSVAVLSVVLIAVRPDIFTFFVGISFVLVSLAAAALRQLSKDKV